MGKETKTSDKPILFNGEMVRAVLSGHKTQTRRVIKPQPDPEFLARGVDSIVPQWPDQDGVRWFMCDGESELVKCPYGRIGDRLWVRETWCAMYESSYEYNEWDYPECSPSDMPEQYGITKHHIKYAADNSKTHQGHWLPSIHMPRWASRITLEITDIRVERVRDISESDAWAEGCLKGEPTDNGGHFPAWVPDNSGVGEVGWDCPREWFADLWDSINEKRGYGWDKNPWVWVVSFKVIEVKGGAS